MGLDEPSIQMSPLARKAGCRSVVSLTNLITCLLLASAGIPTAHAATPRILVYTRTLGYDHATRTVADSVLQLLEQRTGSVLTQQKIRPFSPTRN